MALWSYLAAVPVLAGVVLVHEAGHYVAARRERLAVPEFSIGFGPRVGALQARGTQWSLRAIPLGGYCRFAEEGPGSWARAPLATRARVMLAGPAANGLLFALLLPVVAGLAFPGEPVGQATARLGEFVLTRWWQGFALLLRGGLSDLAGPVMITGLAAQAAGRSMADMLFYVAGLSLNLGLFNLFPLPVLDGGRLLLLGVEWVRGRRLRPEVEEWIFAGGAVAMLALAVLAVAKDVWTLIAGGAA